VTLERARTSLRALSMQVTAKDFRGPHSALLIPLREELAGKTRTALIVLLLASAALLLIACVNLASLLLSRGAVRRREVAVRAAIGAGRGRLIAQFLTESVVLSGLSAVVGLLLAFPAMRLLESLAPESMGAVRLSLDWRVVAVSAMAAIGSALIFGLAPAVHGSRLALLEGLREGARGSAGARKQLVPAFTDRGRGGPCRCAVDVRRVAPSKPSTSAAARSWSHERKDADIREPSAPLFDFRQTGGFRGSGIGGNSAHPRCRQRWSDFANPAH